jgi:hypothetical protein
MPAQWAFEIIKNVPADSELGWAVTPLPPFSAARSLPVSGSRPDIRAGGRAASPCFSAGNREIFKKKQGGD